MVYRDERPEWVDFVGNTAAQYYASVPQDGVLVQTGHMANEPELAFLTEYILRSATEILRGQGYEVDRYDFYLSGLWGQNVQCHGVTNVHVHKNSQISGWFFLETPEGGAYPIYHDTRMNKQMIDLDFVQGSEVMVATNAIHFNNVKPGTFLFANSWMQHQLTQNQSEQQTKTIHFIVSHKDKPCSTC
jgi:uncharacterized protein (TIGR02466 family)